MTEKTPKGEKEMTFWQHLEALRFAFMRIIIVILVFAIAAFIFKEFIYDTVILGPKKPDFISNRFFCWMGELMGSKSLCINQSPLQIINIELAGQFKNHIFISLIAGLVAGFPYLLWEFWRFIKPGLHSNESSHARGFVFVASGLFIAGVNFGYFLINPLAIDFLSTYSLDDEIINQIKLDSYISNVVIICLSSGLVFEFPIIVFFLSKIGLITPEFMKKYRKHAIVLFFIISAIITPPDIFSQILVTVPLLILYEVSIIISRRVIRKSEKALAQM